MLNKIKNRKQEGFTIIEVLIVLAIAGLIMLIVFLAVPALQRNSRNTQRKNDVAAIQGAISNFLSNNNGAMPTQMGYVTADTNSVTVFCSEAAPANITPKDTATYSAANCQNSNKNYEQAKVGLYDVTTSAYITTASSVPTVVASSGTPSDSNININSIVVDLGYQCGATAGTAPTANTRSIAIFYVTEAGGGNGSLQCIGG